MADDRPINSVAKALRVLTAVAAPEPPHRLGAVAARAGVPKATVHRILATLVAEGYAVADGEGRYGVGNELRALAARVLSDDAVGIDAVLRALQQRLGQAVHLAVLSGDHATYTHKVDPGRAYRIATDVGMHLPLHSTAAGRAMLAHLPPREATALLTRTLDDAGARRAAERELPAVRTRGYAVDRDEHQESVCSIAAPVLDAEGYPVGAVAVSSLAVLVTAEQQHAFAPAVREAARDVARRL